MIILRTKFYQTPDNIPIVSQSNISYYRITTPSSNVKISSKRLHVSDVLAVCIVQKSLDDRIIVGSTNIRIPTRSHHCKENVWGIFVILHREIDGAVTILCFEVRIGPASQQYRDSQIFLPVNGQHQRRDAMHTSSVNARAMIKRFDNRCTVISQYCRLQLLVIAIEVLIIHIFFDSNHKTT